MVTLSMPGFLFLWGGMVEERDLPAERLPSRSSHIRCEWFPVSTKRGSDIRATPRNRRGTGAKGGGSSIRSGGISRAATSNSRNTNGMHIGK